MKFFPVVRSATLPALLDWLPRSFDLTSCDKCLWILDFFCDFISNFGFYQHYFYLFDIYLNQSNIYHAYLHFYNLESTFIEPFHLSEALLCM